MRVIIIILCFSVTNYSFSQVGIGTTTPNSSSILDIESTNKGVLFPRLTTVQKNAIVSPEKGLMIFDTDLNCLSINYGTAVTPNWVCQDYIPKSLVTSYTVSNSALIINSTDSNYRNWTDVPDLVATFTLNETKKIKIDWILFTGQNGLSTADGFAQMFTILEINGVNDSDSSNYLPMIHNPSTNFYKLLMNAYNFTYFKEFPPGTYTIKIKVYAAAFIGSTLNGGVTIGAIFNSWIGSANMTNPEKIKSAANKLIITYL